MPRASSSGGRREHVRLVRLATQREHGGVLEEQQLVADGAARAGRREPLLEVPRVAVRDGPQPVDGDRRGGVRDVRGPGAARALVAAPSMAAR